MSTETGLALSVYLFLSPFFLLWLFNGHRACFQRMKLIPCREKNPILTLAKQPKAEWCPGKGSGILGQRNHTLVMGDFSYEAYFLSRLTLEDGRGPLVLKTLSFILFMFVFEYLLPDVLRFKRFGFCVFVFILGRRA